MNVSTRLIHQASGTLPERSAFLKCTEAQALHRCIGLDFVHFLNFPAVSKLFSQFPNAKYNKRDNIAKHDICVHAKKQGEVFQFKAALGYIKGE